MTPIRNTKGKGKREEGKENAPENLNTRTPKQQSSGFSLFPLPFSLLLASLCAVLALGWALTYMVARETPVGKVEGSILLADLQRPLANVEIRLESTDQNWRNRRVRRALTNAAGHFTLINVPEGDYEITASASSHDAKAVKINVLEGKTASIALNLQRNEAELDIKQHQRAFGTKERSHLSVSGYVDSAKALARPPARDTLHLRVFKTRLSTVLTDAAASGALDEVGRSNDATPTLPPALLHPAQGNAPRLLLQRAVAINTADREGFFYQKLDLQKLGLPPATGLYLLDITHAKKSVCSWLLVTDTALIVKRAKSQMVVFAADMETGVPVAASEVKTYRNGRVIAAGQTDARGVAQVTVPAVTESQESDSTRVTTVAVRGEDEAVVTRNAYRDESDSAYVVHAYTDRTVYRPGQRIYFKGIVRQRNDIFENMARPLDAPASPAGLRYRVPAGKSVDVEIRDKGGERILQKRYVTNRYGAFAGQVDLLKEAATGVYTLVMKINGSEHTEDIYVASYHKPEFAVTVTPDKKVVVRGDTVRMTIEGKFFFGAPVANAKVHYSVYSSPDWASEIADRTEADDPEERAPDLGRFRADNYYGASMQSGDVILDENGKAVVTFKGQAPQRHAGSGNDAPDSAANLDEEGPQEETYTLSANVKEGEDREVEATGEARVTRGAFRLTVMPQGYVAAPHQATDVLITARDFDGNAVPNAPVSLETGYSSWKKGEYAYAKLGSLNGVTGADGRVTLSVTPPRNGSLELKARAYDVNHHLLLGRSTVWATSDQGGDLDTTYDDLALLTDKRHYNPGDVARVLINTAHVGQTALLTIEGDRVHRVETIPIKTRSTVVRVPVLAQYGPNVFLSACYVQHKHYATSETPLRVQMPQSELKVTIVADKEKVEEGRSGGVKETNKGQGTSDKEQMEESVSSPPPLLPSSPPLRLPRYAPGDKIAYAVQVTDAQGRPAACELSFGVVDEAIYALREDDPKAMRQAFYPRRVNRVSTEYSFAVEYLGDADKAEPKIETRKRFPDTAYWNPTVQTDANGRANIAFSLPDNLTTWRATAVAHTLDTRIGRGTNKVLVSKDFFVRLQTPRTLTQRDQSRLVAIVHNETASPQTALVRLSAEGLTVPGDATQTLILQPGASGEAVWPVTADAYGEAKLKVTAWTPKMDNAPQYTDGLEVTLPVRPHGREDVTATAGELTAARPSEEIVTLDTAAIAGLSRVTIRVTPSIASSLAGGLDYLIGYPYGCVEQTLSRILPDLQVQRALQSRGLTLNESETRRTGELNLMVREGLARLARFQHPSGAWGWWEHDTDDPWMTGYVLIGLATARAEGYAVSDPVLANGLKAGVQLLAKCKAEEKPFLMYGLALAGEHKAVGEARRTLFLSGLRPENLAYVVLIDAMLGRSDSPAQKLLDSKAVAHDGMLHWQASAGLYSADQDDMTATAMALRVIVRHDPQDPRVAPILRWLMYRRTGEYWGNTRDTAWVLAALGDYLNASPGFSSGGQVTVEVNGNAWQTLALTANNLREKEIVLRVPPALLHAGRNAIRLTRAGGNSPIFYSTQARQTIAGEDIAARANATNTENSKAKGGEAIGIDRQYLRVAAKRAGDNPWDLRTEPTHNQMAAGDRIRVRLTLSVPRDMAYVLIEDPFPAGCEVSERGDSADVLDWNYWWSSVDVRDDRIAFFARSLPQGQHVIEYNLRAQTPGAYHTLPTLLQAMYAPETRAESVETKVEIK